MAAHPGERVTMTFLFTDIEGSTRLWEQHPDRAPGVIERHDQLVEFAVEGRGGTVFHRAGDGMIARFDDPEAALRAAIDAQRALGAAEWTGVAPLRVRMGIHTGSVVERAEGPYGWALNYGTRLTDVGHGGQILLSDQARQRLDAAAVRGIAIRDLGAQQLRDIAQPTSVYQVVVADLDAEFPPLRARTGDGPGAPIPGAPIIGRDLDVEAVLDELRDRRNVTITGISGIGKTSVAGAVASRLAIDRPDSTMLWCDLSGVGAEAVVASVMTTHAIAQRPGVTPLQSLVGWLADRRALVVLDRCEGCASGVAALVDNAAGAEITFLCTSQRVLGTAGERIHRLAPLAIADAVELFVERARSAGVIVTDRSSAKQICERVDAMPFAIEIVAAGSATFTLGELLESLTATGLSGVAHRRDRVAAVQQAVALGIESLDPAMRDRLLAATVFSGSFDRDMFAAVCAPACDPAVVTNTLIRLVDASLLHPEPTGERATFRLLDPVRSVLAADLEPTTLAAARDRLREHAVEISGRIASGLRGAEERRWLRTLQRQFDSLRVVIDRAIESGDVETAVRLASDQWEWAFFRFNSEYFDWGRRVLERLASTEDPRLSLVHGVVALGHWFQDEIGPTFHHGTESIRLERECGGPFSLPARLAMINATVFAGASSPPADVFAEAAAHQLERPEGFYHVNVEAQNAIMATWFGQHDIAEHRSVTCLQLARATGNPSSIAFALWVLGMAIEHVDPERAEHLLDDALAQARDVDNRWVVTLAQTGLASLRRRTSGHLEAAPLIAGLLEQLMRAGHWAQFWNVARLAALVTGDAGDDELAFQIAAAVDAAKITFPALPVDERALSDLRSSITARRGDEWVQRTRRIAATWDAATTATAARRAIADIVASAS